MKLVALGDSLTFGFPFSPRESWVHTTSVVLGLTIYNRGVCGETTGEMLTRLDGVLRLEPDIVIVTGGSNDAILGIIPREVAENFSLMEAQIQSVGAQFVIGLPPPCNAPQEEALLARYRQLLREYAGRRSIPILDFETALLAVGPLPTSLLIDGWHPTEAGYRLLALEAIRVLSSLVNGTDGDR